MRPSEAWGGSGRRPTGLPVTIASETIATLSAVTKIVSAAASRPGYEGGPSPGTSIAGARAPMSACRTALEHAGRRSRAADDQHRSPVARRGIEEVRQGRQHVGSCPASNRGSGRPGSASGAAQGRRSRSRGIGAVRAEARPGAGERERNSQHIGVVRDRIFRRRDDQVEAGRRQARIADMDRASPAAGAAPDRLHHRDAAMAGRDGEIGRITRYRRTRIPDEAAQRGAEQPRLKPPPADCSAKI